MIRKNFILNRFLPKWRFHPRFAPKSLSKKQDFTIFVVDFLDMRKTW